MTERKTLIVCGTLLLLACLFAITYLSTTSNNDLTAFGLIGTIVVSVLAGTFGLVRLDRIEQKVDQVHRQTNGELDARIQKYVERGLAATGQHPLPGQSLSEQADRPAR